MSNTFTIKIDCDNAAFEDNGCGAEIARILRRVAAKVEGISDFDNLPSIALMDDNGNKVGRAG